jgi:hypothetical protein
MPREDKRLINIELNGRVVPKPSNVARLTFLP